MLRFTQHHFNPLRLRNTVLGTLGTITGLAPLSLSPSPSYSPSPSSSGSGSGLPRNHVVCNVSTRTNQQHQHQHEEVEVEEHREDRLRMRRVREMVQAGFVFEDKQEEDIPGPSPAYLGERERERLAKQIDGSVLSDTFMRQHTYLRISLTERCNLRCTYCMPEEGVELTPARHLMSTEELLRAARLFVQAGVKKIRLTGGEPTLRKDVVEIVRSLREMQGLEQVAMTSNGMILHRMLPQLTQAGLTHLNLSLDTLRPDRFEQMTRRPAKGLSRVLGVIDRALEQSMEKLKVNFVVMKGVNEDEVLDFVELTKDKPLNVRFIEWMPFQGNVWSFDKMEPYKVTKKRIEDHFGVLQSTAWDKNAVAKDFRVEGFKGEVSFVTSMTEHFCGSCNRLRLMADGNFKVCLFGSEETNLLKPMRLGYTDEEIAHLVHAQVQRKKFKHDGMVVQNPRPMVKIGG